MPSASRIKEVLSSDADAFFEPLARTWVRSRRAHPHRWHLIDLAYGVAITVAFWLLLGSVAGIVVGAVWAVLTGWELIGHLARRRAASGDGD
jgi:hypothetical protein